jgi:hypothetical protein
MHTLAVALSILALPGGIFGQSGTCSRPFEADVQPGSRLMVHVRSGAIEIVGSDRPRLKVTCEVKRLNQAGSVRIDLRAGKLNVHGGSDDRQFRARIEVPNRLHLTVRVPAGEVKISDVTGDKDVELRAGDLTISVGNASDYAHADASVTAGDLTASPFGVIRDGLFRSFSKDNASGKYRLHAQVWAGDLVLR